MEKFITACESGNCYLGMLEPEMNFTTGASVYSTFNASNGKKHYLESNDGKISDYEIIDCKQWDEFPAFIDTRIQKGEDVRNLPLVLYKSLKISEDKFKSELESDNSFVVVYFNDCHRFIFLSELNSNSMEALSTLAKSSQLLSQMEPYGEGYLDDVKILEGKLVEDEETGYKCNLKIGCKVSEGKNKKKQREAVFDLTYPIVTPVAL